MEEYLKAPILKDLYNSRNEEISHFIIKKSKEYNNYRNDIESEIKGLLNYVSSDHYKELESQIEDTLWKIIQFVEYWDETFYRVGIIDGMKLDKELKQEMEKMLKWKN